MSNIFNDPGANSVFGEEISTAQQEFNATRAFYDAVAKEVADTADANFQRIYRPHEVCLSGGSWRGDSILLAHNHK